MMTELKTRLTRISFDIKLIYFNNLQGQPQQNKETQIYTTSHIHVDRVDYHRVPSDGAYVRVELSATVMIDNRSWLLRWGADGKSLDGNNQHNLLMFIWTV